MLKRSTFTLAMIVLLTGGCTMPLDGHLTPTNDGIDLTEYDGVSITGQVAISPVDPATMVPEKLDLAQLQAALATLCMDELIERAPQGDPLGACATSSDIRVGWETGDASCIQSACAAQVLICVGHKNMELAEAVGVTELETRIRAYLPPTIEDGEVAFEWAGTTPSYLGPVTGAGEPYLFRYRIPPLTAEQKTLALTAARAAFRQSGVMSAQVLAGTGCIEAILASASRTPQTLMDYYVHGIAEATTELASTSERLAMNHANVAAARLSQINDWGAAQEAAWKGSLHSQSAAVKVIAGNAPVETLVQGCKTPLANVPQRKAVDLLRTLALDSTLDENLSPDLFIDDVAVGYQVDLNPNGDPSPIDDILWRQGLTRSDLAVARKYLMDEHVAVGRVRTINDQVVGGPARTHGLAPRPLQHPPAYHQERANAAGYVVLDGYHLDSYARRSSVHAVDLLREVSNTMLARSASEAANPLTADQMGVLASASLAAEQFAGRRRIEVFIAGRAAGMPKTVTVRGARASDRYLLVLGDRGYRCALEGSVDGAPCAPEDGPLTTDATFSVAGLHGAPTDNLMVIDFSEATWTVSEAVDVFIPKLYVIDARASGDARLAAVVQLGAGSLSATIPVIAGSIAGSLVGRVTVRQSDQCGVPANMCGDTEIDRDYVPPLENELTEDSDPYENSWKHYLNLATSAAQEADALGEQLVQTGLEMDLRAEAAIEELEGICGGYVSLPFAGGAGCTPGDEGCDVVTEQFSENTQLDQCIGSGAERVDFTTLGDQPVCVFYWGGDGSYDRMCQCLEGGNCSRQCPVIAEGVSTDDQCAAKFGVVGPWSIDGGESSPVVRFKLVSTKLNVFHGGNTTPAVGSTACEEIDRLASSGVQNAAHNVRSVLESNPWINFNDLRGLVSRLGFQSDVLHHYTVTMDGVPVWSTRLGECPRAFPWRPQGPSNSPIGCVRPGDDPLGPTGSTSPTAWLSDEFGKNGGPSYVFSRATWGGRMRANLLALGILTGEVSRIQLADWWYYHADYRDSQIELFPAAPPRLPARFQVAAFDNQQAACLHEIVPLALGESDDYYRYDSGVGACRDIPASEIFNVPVGFPVDCGPGNGSLQYSFSRFRFTYDLDFKAETGGEALRAFWSENGLTDFLAGAVAPGEMARLESAYVRPVRVTMGKDPNGRAQVVFSRVNGDDPLDWWEENNCNHSLAWNFADTIDTGRLVEILRMACDLQDRAAGTVMPCDPRNPGEMPNIGTIRDLRRVGDYLMCVADGVQNGAATLVLPNLPKALVDGFQRQGMEGLYGTYQGEFLKALLTIEADLRKFGDAASNSTRLLMESRLLLQEVMLADKYNEGQQEVNTLQTTRNVLADVAAACSAAAQVDWKHFWDASKNVFNGAAAALHLVNAGLDARIGALNGELLKIQENQNFVGAMQKVLSKLGEFKQVLSDIAAVHESIQSNLTTLDSLERRATIAYAKATFADSATAGRVLPVNTVMRRRHNTIRERYEKAAARAKKLAFIARRAIEFRLGVNLNEMNDTLTLVPPPSTWADRICTMQGFDYERLRDPSDLLLDPAVPGSDSYANWYIGDYVKMLGDFVESYNLDFPFTDERDVAIVSVRDDLMRARQTCEVEGGNLVKYSEGFEFSEGWQIAGCLAGDPGCIQVLPNDPASSQDATFSYDDLPTAGDLIFEPPAVTYDSTGLNPITHRPTEDGTTWRNSGYLRQTISGVAAGNYRLSWWVRGAAEGLAVGYMVRVLDTSHGGAVMMEYVTTPSSSWSVPGRVVEVLEDADLEVQVHPSVVDSSGTDPIPSPEFGRLWIWGMQLERLSQETCEWLGGCSEVPRGQYFRTEERTLRYAPACLDLDGSAMRRSFNWRCVCLDQRSGICPEGSEGASYRRCFWEYPFSIDLDQLDRGEKIHPDLIATGNFNYRQEALAVNVVGTNVLDCTGPDAGPTCFTNAFVPFTLHQQGAVDVRNHTGHPESFTMPSASIEHGKALAAEVVLTSPLTGTGTQLLTDYWKDGLRGRPLPGQYVLRIWDTPGLQWSAVEDIQIVWRYRYWTRMGTSY